MNSDNHLLLVPCNGAGNGESMRVLILNAVFVILGVIDAYPYTYFRKQHLSIFVDILDDAVSIL